MTTHLTFSLDHWLLATAQLIYMIRIGLQIANLMSDLKRIAIAIAFQNIYAHSHNVYNDNRNTFDY